MAVAIADLDPARAAEAVALWRAVGLTRPWNDPLRERSVPKLELLIRRGNAAVAAFYAALGYGTEDVLVMSRRLD